MILETVTAKGISFQLYGKYTKGFLVLWSGFLVVICSESCLFCVGVHILLGGGCNYSMGEILALKILVWILKNKTKKSRDGNKAVVQRMKARSCLWSASWFLQESWLKCVSVLCRSCTWLPFSIDVVPSWSMWKKCQLCRNWNTDPNCTHICV